LATDTWRAGVAEQVKVIIGAALDRLPRLGGRFDPFDLIFVDADMENNSVYAEWAIKLGATGSASWWTTSSAFVRNRQILELAADDHQARPCPTCSR
jgi:O-methyltransferase